MPLNCTHIRTYRVSSTLNRDVKSYGKQYMFDGKEDTCWNSEKGSPQWLQIELKEPHTIQALRIQFQGGFAGKQCNISMKPPDGDEVVQDFYPDDSNALQTFQLQKMLAESVTITFEQSTDFFGRIIVYNIDFVS